MEYGNGIVRDMVLEGVIDRMRKVVGEKFRRVRILRYVVGEGRIYAEM